MLRVAKVAWYLILCCARFAAPLPPVHTISNPFGTKAFVSPDLNFTVDVASGGTHRHAAGNTMVLNLSLSLCLSLSLSSLPFLLLSVPASLLPLYSPFYFLPPAFSESCDLVPISL